MLKLKSSTDSYGIGKCPYVHVLMIQITLKQTAKPKPKPMVTTMEDYDVMGSRIQKMVSSSRQ